MMTREELVDALKKAKQSVGECEQALREFDLSAKNNVFGDGIDAECTMQDMLYAMADADCEGSHRCGKPMYQCGFIVDGVEYVGRLKVEYNRYDKRYYYVDGTEFSCEPVSA